MAIEFVKLPYNESQITLSHAIFEAEHVYYHFAAHNYIAEHLAYLSKAIQLGDVALFAARAGRYGIRDLNDFGFFTDLPVVAHEQPRYFLEHYPHEFEKLLSERALIAAGMVRMEVTSNGHIRWLTEPFLETTILPQLYRKYLLGHLANNIF